MKRILSVDVFILLFAVPLHARIPELRVPRGDGGIALDLLDLDISVTIRGDLARTEFVLVYGNAENSELRGKFLFPLPEDATVTDVGLYFNDRLRYAVAVERRRARQVYDEIVHRRVDPALVEWMSGNTFQLEVFPIPARGEKKIYICYEQDLGEQDYSLDLGYGRKLRGL